MQIFKMDIERNLKSLLMWAGVSATVMALMLLLYPGFMKSDMLALMNAKIASLPEELMNALNMSGQDIRKLPEFFANMFQFILMAACIYGAIIGFTALSREESEGTIEFLYAKPVKRSAIVTGKISSACLRYLVYFAHIGILALVSCMVVRPADLPLEDMIARISAVLFGGMVAGFTYLFVGFALSVFLRKARHAASMAVAVFFLTYIPGNISAMLGALDALKWFSPMNYFMPRSVVMDGINWVHVPVCAAIMGVCLAVAYAGYRKKDFNV